MTLLIDLFLREPEPGEALRLCVLLVLAGLGGATVLHVAGPEAIEAFFGANVYR